MSLREHIKRLEDRNGVVRVTKPISKTYQIAGVLKKLEPTPVLFDNVIETPFKVVGNLLCSKAAFADYFGIQVSEIIPTLTRAIDNRTPPEIVHTAPCQEVVISNPDLDRLPILKHCEGDGGNYITSGVMIAKHPQHGQNVDFHRCMQFSKTEMAVRVVCFFAVCRTRGLAFAAAPQGRPGQRNITQRKTS